MRFEAEVISEDILPAIRSILASRLHGDYGLTQQEIAQKLEVTQPAVSQYINNQRAKEEVKDKLKADPQIDIILEDALNKVAQRDDHSPEISKIVRTVRDKGILKERFNAAEKL